MSSPTILADTRWIGRQGIGRFTEEVVSRLPDVVRLEGDLPLLHPLEPLWLSWKLFRARPDVYFSPGFNPPAWSPVPFVFTIWDLIYLHVPETSGRRQRAYYRLVVRPAAARASRILTGSEFSKLEVLEWTRLPEERVTVVGSGVGPSFSPLGALHNPGYPYLLYVGNRKPHKNLARLLRAYAASKARSQVRLLLTGEPEENLARLARELGVFGNVVFAGPIPDRELPSIYRGAVALVFPSLYEGFGLPPLEAMASGTPVIAANATSLPEVVADAGMLVDPTDVDSITDAIDRVVDDPALAEAYRRKGLDRARNFSWDRTAKLTAAVLADAAR